MKKGYKTKERKRQEEEEEEEEKKRKEEEEEEKKKRQEEEKKRKEEEDRKREEKRKKKEEIAKFLEDTDSKFISKSLEKTKNSIYKYLNELNIFVKNNEIKQVEFDLHNMFLYMYQVNDLVEIIERKTKKNGISFEPKKKKFSERISFIHEKLNYEEAMNEINEIEEKLKKAEENINFICNKINECKQKDKSYIVKIVNSLYLSEPEIQFDDDDDISLFYDCYLKLKPLIDRHLKLKDSKDKGSMNKGSVNKGSKDKGSMNKGSKNEDSNDEDPKDEDSKYLKCDWNELAKDLEELKLFSEENIYQTISYIKEVTKQYKPCDQASIKLCQKNFDDSL